MRLLILDIGAHACEDELVIWYSIDRGLLKCLQVEAVDLLIFSNDQILNFFGVSVPKGLYLAYFVQIKGFTIPQVSNG